MSDESPLPPTPLPPPSSSGWPTSPPVGSHVEPSLVPSSGQGAPPQPPGNTGGDGRPWWRKWWVIALACVIVLFVLVGLFANGGDDEEAGSDTTSSPATTSAVADSSTAPPVTTSAVADSSTAPPVTTSPSEVPTTDTAVPSVTGGSVEGAALSVESGFSTEISSSGTRNTTAGAVVTNPRADEAACGVQVTFTLTDAAGVAVDTTTESVSWIPKSGRAVVAPLLLGFDIPQEPTALSVTTVVESYVDTDEFDGCDNFAVVSGVQLTVNSAGIERDSFFTTVTGQVTNETNDLVDSSFVNCILRAGGAIVGGASTAILDPIQPGQTIAFDSGSISVVPATADTVECQVEAGSVTGGSVEGAALSVESGFSTEISSSGTRNTTAGAVVTNPRADEAACGVQVTFTLTDAAGVAVDTTTESVSWIPKSGRAVVAPLLLGFDIPQEPTALSVTTVVESYVDTDEFDGCDNFAVVSGVQLTVNSAGIERDSFFTTVTGQVTNETNDLVDSSFVNCILRAGGAIVGGASTAILDPIQPGQTIAFDSGSISVVPATADTVECQVEAVFQS